MEAATSPTSEAELELAGPDWDAFKAMMEDTTADSDLVRIDWLLEKVTALKAEIAENDAVAKRRMEMQEDFRQGENAKIENAITYWVGQIGQLAPSDGDAFKAEYGKKSRTLAHGTFGYRTRPDRVEIDGMEAVVLFAKGTDIPIKVVHTISKTDLKKHAQKTGLLDGPGWHLVPGGDEFFVTPAK